MAINFELLKQLKEIYRNEWPVDQQAIPSLLSKSYKDPNLQDTVKAFLDYIDSPDGKHPSLLRNVTDSFLWGGIEYTRQSPKFHQLEKTLKSFLPQPSYAEQVGTLVTSLLANTVDACKKIGYFILTNPGKALTLATGAYASLNIPQAQAAITDQSDAVANGTATLSSHGFIQQEFMQQSINQSEYVRELMRSNTYVSATYAEELSSREIETKIDDMMKLAEVSFQYPERMNKIQDVYKSDKFQLQVVDKFDDYPQGVGVYRRKEHMIEMRDQKKLDVCNDAEVTFHHELHHAHVRVQRGQGKHLEYKAEASYSEPFTDATEQRRLRIAIEKGDRRVIETFGKLHHLHLTGQLTNPEDIASYDRFKMGLADYQPRCVATYRKGMDDLTIRNAKDKLAAGEKLTIDNIHVTHILNVIQMPGVTAFNGYHVDNPSDPEKKPEAVIRDTRWRLNNYGHMYRDDSGKKLLTETDAEINANSPKFLHTFYSELVAYHNNFTAKLNKERNEATEPSRLITSPRPFYC